MLLKDIHRGMTIVKAISQGQFAKLIVTAVGNGKFLALDMRGIENTFSEAYIQDYEPKYKALPFPLCVVYDLSHIEHLSANQRAIRYNQLTGYSSTDFYRKSKELETILLRIV